jgi:hypothetical protein
MGGLRFAQNDNAFELMKEKRDFSGKCAFGTTDILWGRREHQEKKDEKNRPEDRPLQKSPHATAAWGASKSGGGKTDSSHCSE